jgi:hypothetical protein
VDIVLTRQILQVTCPEWIPDWIVKMAVNTQG